MFASTSAPQRLQMQRRFFRHASISCHTASKTRLPLLPRFFDPAMQATARPEPDALDLQLYATTRTNAVPSGGPAVRGVGRLVKPLVAGAAWAFCFAHEARRLPDVEVHRFAGKRFCGLPSLTSAASVWSSSFSVSLHAFFAHDHICSFPLSGSERKFWTFRVALATQSRLYAPSNNRFPIHIVAAPVLQQHFAKTLLSLLEQVGLEGKEAWRRHVRLRAAGLRKTQALLLDLLIL